MGTTSTAAHPNAASPRVIRDAEFGRRLALACDRQDGCPPLNRGRLTWIQRELAERFNENVSVESVRKWLSGEARPRPEKTALLATLLGVDRAWLQIGTGQSPDAAERPAHPLTERRHPLFGAMKGTFTIAEGVDLTEPADPDWADLADQKASRWQF